MGQRATVSGGAAFDDVAVDPSLVIRNTTQAFERPQQLGARTQLVHAAIEAGIAGGALRDAGDFLRTGRARSSRRRGPAGPRPQPPIRTPSTGTVSWPPRWPRPRRCWPRRPPRWTRSAGYRATRRPRPAARLAVAQAKAFATEVAAEVASDLFALSGASATDERHDLSRHWRNARTHGSHDPVAWKYHHVGNYLLNGALPPNHGQI